MHIMLISACCYSFFKNFNMLVANQKLRKALCAKIYKKNATTAPNRRVLLYQHHISIFLLRIMM